MTASKFERNRDGISNTNQREHLRRRQAFRNTIIIKSLFYGVIGIIMMTLIELNGYRSNKPHTSQYVYSHWYLLIYAFFLPFTIQFVIGRIDPKWKS
jgi:hypothetical protein